MNWVYLFITYYLLFNVTLFYRRVVFWCCCFVFFIFRSKIQWSAPKKSNKRKKKRDYSITICLMLSSPNFSDNSHTLITNSSFRLFFLLLSEQREFCLVSRIWLVNERRKAIYVCFFFTFIHAIKSLELLLKKSVNNTSPSIR